MTTLLLFRSVRHEWPRLLSAVLGVAAATGLLAWHLGLACTAIHSGHDAAERAAAPFSAWIGPPAPGPRPEPPKAEPKPSPKGRARATAEATGGRRMMGRGGGRPIPPRLVKALEASPVVEKVVPLATIGITMDVRPGGRVLQGPPFSGRVAELPQNGIPFNVGEIEGRLPDPASEMPEVVASESLFGTRVPKPEVGSELPFVLAKGTVNVKIVGFFKMSGLVPAFPTLYVNKAAMDAVAKLSPDFRPLPNLLLVVTRKDANPADLGRVIDEVPEADACQLYTVDAVASRFRSDTVSHLVSQLPMSLTLAVITASCLMATVLLIGVALQRRRIAELRCAGMTRGGVARLLLAETALMVVPGWFLGLGCAAICLQIFLWTESGGGELPSVIHLGWQTPVFSAVLAFIVGVLAVIVPALRAMRVKPLEVIGNDISESRPVSPVKAALAVCLLLPLPLVAIEPALPEVLKSTLMLCVCLPCFIASLILGMHPLMRLVELVFLRPVGWMLHLDPKLLQRRLSRDPARAAGTVLTLALGLGGFVAIHIWGGTLMSSFVPSPEWPDVIVSALPSGLTADQVAAVRTCEGVADGRVIDIECTQFPMALADGTKPEGVLLLFGADPIEAFGEKALAPFRFIEGDRVEAARAMASGDCCIITKMLSNITGLHKGDSFQVAGRTLQVAGVTDLNWHMVTSRALVRTRFGGKRQPPSPEAGAKPPRPNDPADQRFNGPADQRFNGSTVQRSNGSTVQRSNGSTVQRTNGSTVQRFNGSTVQRTMGVAFVSERFVRDLTDNDDRTFFLWLSLSPDLRAMNGLKASVLLDSQIRAAINPDGSSAIRVHHRDEISDGTLAHGSDILGAMARIPFWSLAVTSTGIVVLLIASVRGSKREFEVMRAIGMTRSQLGRLIFGEALLVTLAALVLSLLTGILVGWSFTGLSRWLMSAGLDVKLIVPWATIGKGVLFALGLCVVMAALPLSRLVRLADE